jgi:hypothetical protein
MDGNIPYHDSLEYHFGSFSLGTVFIKNTSAFESLKSIGIDLISNDSLRQQITQLYAVSYDYILSVQEVMHNYMVGQLNQAISEHLLTIEFLNKAVPLDTLELRTSNSLRHALIYNIGITEYQLRSYQTAKERIISLINQLEKELL